jgi:hypothetical protein
MIELVEFVRRQVRCVGLDPDHAACNVSQQRAVVLPRGSKRGRMHAADQLCNGPRRHLGVDAVDRVERRAVEQRVAGVAYWRERIRQAGRRRARRGRRLARSDIGGFAGIGRALRGS